MIAINNQYDIYKEITAFLQKNGLLWELSFKSAYRFVSWYASNAYLFVAVDDGKINGVCLARQCDVDSGEAYKSFSHNPYGDMLVIEQMAADSLDISNIFYFEMIKLFAKGKQKALPKYFGWRRSKRDEFKYYKTEHINKMIFNRKVHT